MSPALILIPLGLGALLLCISGLWMMNSLAHARRLEARVRRAQGIATGTGARRGAEGGRASLRLLARIGAAITRSGLLPRATLAQIDETLVASGFRAGNALALFVGAKVLLLAAVPGITALVLPHLDLAPLTHAVAMAVAVLVGLLAPDYVVGRIRATHLHRVEHGLPDALDMMVICAEAGLGLEPAIARVGAEIRAVHPALAQEFARTSGELQFIADSRVALTNLGTRTGLDCLKRLGSTLIQTMQYGTPLSAALRVLAAELRQETLTKFEERAARLPVLLTLPMILFILPCVFLVVGGPAVIQVVNVMK